jgi:hypothetical protein
MSFKIFTFIVSAFRNNVAKVRSLHRSGEINNSILKLFHNLYSSPSIIRMIKSRRMRWARHVARRREKRNAYRIFVGNPEGKRPL